MGKREDKLRRRLARLDKRKVKREEFLRKQKVIDSKSKAALDAAISAEVESGNTIDAEIDFLESSFDTYVASDKVRDANIATKSAKNKEKPTSALPLARQLEMASAGPEEKDTTSPTTKITVDPTEPKRKSQPIAKRAKSLARKAGRAIFGERTATNEEEGIRKEYQRIVSQKDQSVRILMENMQLLQEKAETDPAIAKLLVQLKDKKYEDVERLVKEGRQVFPEQAEDFIEGIEELAKSMEGIDVSLKMSIPSIIDQTKKVLGDKDATLAEKRETLSAFQKLIRKSDVDLDTQKEIRVIAAETFNATKEENASLNLILGKISNNNKDKKLVASYQELADLSGNQLLTLKQIKKTSDKQLANGESQKDSFLKRGIGAVKGTATRGLLGFGLNQVGLGGLDNIVEDLGDLKDTAKLGYKGVKKGLGSAGRLINKISGGRSGRFGGKLLSSGGRLLSKIPGLGKFGTGLLSAGSKLLPAAVGGVGVLGTAGAAGTATAAAGGLATATKGAGLLSKLSGFAGGGAKLAGTAARFAGGLAKFAGPIGIAITAGMAVKDAVDGFNNAEKIAGIEPGKKASLGQKIQSGLSSAVSGLTLGFIEPETIYGAVDDFFSPMFGKDGFISQVGDIGSRFSKKLEDGVDLKDFTSTFGEFFDSVFSTNGILAKTTQMAGKILEYSPVGYTAKALNWISNKVTGQNTSVGEKLASVLPKGVAEFTGISKPTDTASFIGKHEGTNNNVYKDVAGLDTVGKGHLLTNSKRDQAIKERGYVTKEEGEEIFQEDIAKHQTFKQQLAVPISKNMETAMTSLAFNLGANHPAIQKITALVNAGKTQEAAAEFLKYDKAKDKDTGLKRAFAGLTRRRQDEANLFLTPDGRATPSVSGTAALAATSEEGAKIIPFPQQETSRMDMASGQDFATPSGMRKSAISMEPISIQSKAFQIASTQNATEVAATKASLSKSQSPKTPPISLVSNDSSSKGGSRATQIDDMMLSVMNTTMLD